MAGTITIGNLKNTKEGVRCDRGTVYGNPFEMKSEVQRDMVCVAHKKYLWLVMAHGYSQKDAANKVASEMGLEVSSKMKTSTTFVSSVQGFSRQIKEGRDYVFLCWCHPKKCHCENLRDLIYYLANKDKCKPNSSTA